MKNWLNIAVEICVFGVGLIIVLLILGVFAKQIYVYSKLGIKVKYIEDKLKKKALGIVKKDEYTGWGYSPNSSEKDETSDYSVVYSTNSAGLRENEVLIDKSSGVFRIIALGESTVFGVGVNFGNRFTDIIEKSLDKVEVVNMGVQGFGADQALLLLERDGFQYKPDLVILFGIQDFFERCNLYRRLGQVKPRFILNEQKDGLVFQDLAYVNKELMPLNSSPETSRIQTGDVLNVAKPTFT